MRVVFGQYLFVKGLSLCYFIAFASLFFQFKGLYGSRGITPLSNWMEKLAGAYGSKRFWYVPSLFWLRSDDWFQGFLLTLGMVTSLAVFAGFHASTGFLICFLLYGSYTSLNTLFLGYQWDGLIQEVGFLAIFYCLQSPPHLLWQVAIVLLLFRLMFSSGVVKLTSRCPEWRSCRAMDLHYESQPIPNRIAWFVHQQAKWHSTMSCYAVFFMELVVPFFLLFPSPWGEMGAGILILLQVLILLTGNFAFFNILSITLCFPALPDSFWSHLVPISETSSQVPMGAWGLLLSIPAVAIILLNTLQIANLWVMLGPTSKWLTWAGRWHICCSYGLFARMTGIRNEIIVQGSHDGQNWQSYQFYWKPGDPKRAPSQVAPHQPRLDWQMWFAALGSYQQNGWYIEFLQRLLVGEESVLRLLRSNPFKEKPPKYIRSEMYEYHFSDWQTRKETGAWWTRTFRGLYAPTVCLNEEQQVIAANLP